MIESTQADLEARMAAMVDRTKARTSVITLTMPIPAYTPRYRAAQASERCWRARERTQINDGLCDVGGGVVIRVGPLRQPQAGSNCACVRRHGQCRGKDPSTRCAARICRDDEAVIEAT